MKKLILLLPLLLCSCHKKDKRIENPLVTSSGGVWTGTGTDDAIGFYNISMNLLQDENTASGSFTLVSDVATIKGDVYIVFNGSAVQSLKMRRNTWNVAEAKNANRVCTGDLTARADTKMNSNSMVFTYTMSDCQTGTWSGGTNLHKIASSN